MLDEHGAVVGDSSPSVRRRAAQAVIDLLNYGELFTAYRPAPGPASLGRGLLLHNRGDVRQARHELDPPLTDGILQPMLAAALCLTSAIGPHAVTLSQQVREADHLWGYNGPGEFARPARAPVAEIARLLDRYQRVDVPLPMVPGHIASERLTAGWRPDDPLLTVGLHTLARQAGIARFRVQWLSQLHSASCGNPLRRQPGQSAFRRCSLATRRLLTAPTGRAGIGESTLRRTWRRMMNCTIAQPEETWTG